jgi:hypothetical protein
VRVIAGALEGVHAPAPPPDSWAASPGAEVAIWTIRLDAGAEWSLPRAPEGVHRVLYFFRGESLRVADRTVDVRSGVQLAPHAEVKLAGGEEPAELLLLQGRPIGEPVAQEGPFVMNTPAEVRQAYLDYQKTRFGGWPFPSDAPVHAREEERFARFPDGRIERPE